MVDVAVPIVDLPQANIDNNDQVVFDQGGFTKRTNEENVAFGTTEFPIRTMDDFPPADVSNIRTLPSGVYIIKNSLTTGDKFATAPGANVMIKSADRRNATLTSSNVGTIFTAAANGFLEFEDVIIIMTGVGAKFVETTGGVTNFRDISVLFGNTGQTIGTLTNNISNILTIPSFVGLNFATQGFENGLTWVNPGGVIIDGAFFSSKGTATGAILDFTGNFTQPINIDGTALITNPTGVNFAISLSANIIKSLNTTVFLNKVVKQGLGGFYKPASVTNVDIGTYSAVSEAVQNESITGLTAPFTVGLPALFTSGDTLDFNDGDIIDHTNFAGVPFYNGTDLEVFDKNVGGTNVYKVRRRGVTILSTGVSSSGQADRFQLTFTTPAQTIPVNSGIIIFGNVNYNLEKKVIARTNTEFTVFGKQNNLTAQTGDWKLSSLEQNSNSVDVEKSPDSPDSKVTGGFFSSGGTVASNLNINTFEDMLFPSTRSAFANNEGIEYNGTGSIGEIIITSKTKNKKLVIPLSITLNPNTGTNVNSSIILRMEHDKNDGSGYAQLADNVETELFFRGTNQTFLLLIEVRVNEQDKIKFTAKSGVADPDTTVVQANIMI